MTVFERFDPLLCAIGQYQAAMKAYDIHPLAGGMDDDDAIAETYGPPLARLQHWQAPATTRAGAIAALRLAAGDLDGCVDVELVESMIKAALRFFEAADVTAGTVAEDDIDAVHDVLAFLDIAGSLLANGIGDQEAGSLAWLMGNAGTRLRGLLARMELAARPAPACRQPAPIDSSRPDQPTGFDAAFRDAIDGVEDHRHLHEVLDLVSQLEAATGVLLAHPRFDDEENKRSADAIQILNTFFNDMIDAVHRQAKAMTPISRDAADHRALILIGYEVQNRAFADEVLAVAKSAVADIECQGWPANRDPA